MSNWLVLNFAISAFLRQQDNAMAHVQEMNNGKGLLQEKNDLCDAVDESLHELCNSTELAKSLQVLENYLSLRGHLRLLWDWMPSLSQTTLPRLHGSPWRDRRISSTLDVCECAAATLAARFVYLLLQPLDARSSLLRDPNFIGVEDEWWGVIESTARLGKWSLLLRRLQWSLTERWPSEAPKGQGSASALIRTSAEISTSSQRSGLFCSSFIGLSGPVGTAIDSVCMPWQLEYDHRGRVIDVPPPLIINPNAATAVCFVGPYRGVAESPLASLRQYLLGPLRDAQAGGADVFAYVAVLHGTKLLGVAEETSVGLGGANAVVAAVDFTPEETGLGPGES